MANPEKSVFTDPRNLDRFINNLVKLHIPRPEMGGRARFFCRVETVLEINVFLDTGTRKITIKGSRYPSDDSAERVQYEITDSMFPGGTIFLNKEFGMVLEEATDSKYLTPRNPDAILRDLLESISNPKASVSAEIKAIVPEDMKGFIGVGRDGVLRGDVPRMRCE